MGGIFFIVVLGIDFRIFDGAYFSAYISFIWRQGGDCWGVCGAFFQIFDDGIVGRQGLECQVEANVFEFIFEVESGEEAFPGGFG